MLKLLFEMITMFSQVIENSLANLLWSFKLYQGAKMFLILITPHEKYDYKCQKQFSQHTSAFSPVARFTERLITCLSPKTYLTTHLRPKTCLILKICIKTGHKSILTVN